MVGLYEAGACKVVQSEGVAVLYNDWHSRATTADGSVTETNGKALETSAPWALRFSCRLDWDAADEDSFAPDLIDFSGARALKTGREDSQWVFRFSKL